MVDPVRLGLVFSSLILYSRISLAQMFNILTFNVAGLPAILNDNAVPGDKEENTRIIGTKFAEYGYDVIHVQEDFNYHAALYKADNHPYRTPTTGGAGLGSGLNTLANFPWIDFERITWNDCSLNSGDCLTPKGFTTMRVQLAEGVFIDFYNLHADAGSDVSDQQARISNFNQMADFMSVYSAGNAVVVFGDTNSRYTSTASENRIFGERVGLRDPWVELVKGGTPPVAGADPLVCENPSTTNECETVDKVFYRGSRAIDLQPSFWNYESLKLLQPSGDILSDHNPISVNFTYTLSDSYRQSSTLGGPHGTWFNDLPILPSTSRGVNKPSQINLRGSSRLDSIGLKLSSGMNYTHGGTGGSARTLPLTDSEFWTEARLCQGNYGGHTRIFYVLATTSLGNTVTIGTETGDCATFAAPSGWQIVGYFGRGGDEIDRLGFWYAPQ